MLEHASFNTASAPATSLQPRNPLASGSTRALRYSTWSNCLKPMRTWAKGRREKTIGTQSDHWATRKWRLSRARLSERATSLSGQPGTWMWWHSLRAAQASLQASCDARRYEIFGESPLSVDKILRNQSWRFCDKFFWIEQWAWSRHKAPSSALNLATSRDICIKKNWNLGWIRHHSGTHAES